MNNRFPKNITMTAIFTLVMLFFTQANLSQAQEPEKLPAGAKVEKIFITPLSLDLVGPFSYSQVLLTGILSTGDNADLTRIGKWTVPEDLVKISPSGIISPLKDGTGMISASFDGQSISIPFKISQTKSLAPTSFINDVMPLLARTGCNQGTCHGSAEGKNGFKLSLRGYD